MFEGRVAQRFVDAAPRVEADESGMEYWLYDGKRHYKVGLNAVVGRPMEERSFEPVRFDEMRAGAYDIDARVRDMDLNGVYASLNFPSSLAGFAGQRYQLDVSDPDLALAVVRAANDWHLEEWAGTHPGRIIPCQVPWLLDPELGAEEIRRNAARGFRAVTFPELPERLGPAVAAHRLLGAVHRRVRGDRDGRVPPRRARRRPRRPRRRTRRPTPSACCSSGGRCSRPSTGCTRSCPVRYPDLRICLSEGGMGWVAGLLDRLDHVARYQQMYGTWDGIELSPRDVMQRNFWFCAIDDPAGLDHRDRVGIDHVLLETDYPHQDGTWPDTQEILHAQIGHFPPDDIRKLTWENASRLFGHPVPDAVQRDPDAY